MAAPKYIPFVRRLFPGIPVVTPPIDAQQVDIVASIPLPIVITDPVDVSGSSVFANMRDGVGNPLSSTGTSLDVNITGGVAISVGIDYTTDSVTVYGSRGAPLQQAAVSNDLIVTLDGESISVTQGTSPWIVSATNLDIRDLVFATDKVDVSGSTIAATIAANVTVDQGTSPWVVSLASTTITGTVTVAATNLDIRDLVFATDKVDVSGSVISAAISGNVTVDQGTSPWVVSLASTTITGTVAVTQSTSPWVVSATNLDIRDLVFATDKVDVSGSTITSMISGNVTADQGTSPWVVSATNLDIRDLVFASDKVDVSGSTLGANSGVDIGDVTINNATLAVTQSTSPWVVSGAVATTEASPTTIFNGLTKVTTAGTRVVLAASTVVKSVTIKAAAINTGLIYVGNSTVDSSNGFQLAAGDSVSMDISNLNTVNIDSSVNNEGVTYIGVN